MKFIMLALVTVLLALMMLGAAPATAQNRENSKISRFEETSQAAPYKGRYITVTGVLKKQQQGTTAPQYGTHRIFDLKTRRFYALYGKRGINLNRYVGRRVVVVGKRVRGYPTKIGPPLLKGVEGDQGESCLPNTATELTRLG